MSAGLLIVLGIIFFCTVAALVFSNRQTIIYRRLYRAKQEQSDALSKFRTILYSIGDAVITTDTQGCIMQMNPVAETLCGWKESEARTRPLEEVFRIVNEETHAAVRSPTQYVLQHGKASDLVNHTLLIARDGKEYPVSDSAAPVLDEHGHMNGVVLVFRDQTAERATQKAVLLSERRLKTLIENVPGIVYRCGTDTYWTMQFISSNCKLLTGYEVSDLLDNKRISFFDLIHPNDRQGVWDLITAAIKCHEPYTLEYRIVTADGTTKWVWERGRAVRDLDDAQDTLEGVIHDITDRKLAADEQVQLAEHLHQVQKLEALGCIAGSVAHDLNNTLAIIIGNAELMDEQTATTNERHTSLLEILKAGEHATGLAKRLLGFAHKQPILPRSIDLNETLKGMKETLAHVLGARITLEWRLGDLLWPILMDPGQVSQILINLATNAHEAILGNGTFTLETTNIGANIPLPGDAYGDSPAGDYVLISVRDTGCGMDASTQSKIFEPFFTSKPDGMGTGMGLSIIYDIVKKNKGLIRVTSAPGEGSCFHIYLPRFHPASKSLPAESPPSAGPPNAKPVPPETHTLLLVEDEPALLNLTQKFLSAQGYAVISASSASEALRLSRAYAGDIHLLLSDLVMPNMNGLALWEVLSRERPGLKRLFVSGFAAYIISQHDVLSADTPFLQKPFARATLAAKIQEVLSS